MGCEVAVSFKDGVTEQFENVTSWRVEDGLLALALKGEKSVYVPLSDIRLFGTSGNGGNGGSAPKEVKALKDYPCQGGCGATIGKGSGYYWVRPNGDATKAMIRVCPGCFQKGVGLPHEPVSE